MTKLKVPNLQISSVISESLEFGFDLKSVFGLEFREFFQPAVKQYSHETRFNPCEEDTKYQKTGENQNSSLNAEDLWWPSLISHHTVGHFAWQPLPKITIIASMVLQCSIQKLNSTKFWSIFNLSTIFSAITTNNKNDYHCSAIQDRNLQRKPNTTKFWSIFNLNML